MSLDVDLIAVRPVSVFSYNITHNLGKMANQVNLSDGNTLYKVLWRPDECGYTKASEISELLDEGFTTLLADPEFFRGFDPENGWGDYEGLVKFVYEYRNACWDNPDGEIRVSR